MRISDWSSDVCSSDLHVAHILFAPLRGDDDLVAVVALRIGALAFLLRDCVFPLCDCGKKAEDARAGEQDPKLCILEFRHHDTPPKLRSAARIARSPAPSCLPASLSYMQTCI